MAYTPLTIALYGSPGQGKTALATTAPTPALLIDPEGSSHFAHGVEAGRPKKLNVTRWEIGKPLPSEIGDYCAVTVGEWRHFGPVLDVLSSGKHPFRSVIIDSLTEVQQRLHHLIIEDSTRDALQQADWGTSRNRLGIFLRKLRDMAVVDLDNPVQCIVFIALAKDAENLTAVTRPALQGSISNDFESLVEVIGYVRLDHNAEEQTTDQVVLIGPHNKYQVKNRIPDLWEHQPTMVNPNLAELFDFIQPQEKE